MLQSINIALNLSAFILSGMLLIAALAGGNLREKVFRWFFALVLITCAGAPGDTVIMVLSGTPGPEVTAIIRIIDFLNYGAMGITLIAMGMYLYEILSPQRKCPQSFCLFSFWPRGPGHRAGHRWAVFSHSCAVGCKQSLQQG